MTFCHFRQYWHSHRYEVDSGMLMLGTKTLVPSMSRSILISLVLFSYVEIIIY